MTRLVPGTFPAFVLYEAAAMLFALAVYLWPAVRRAEEEGAMAHIDDYSFGQIVIDGRTYTSDLILLPHRVIENWWREEGHVLHASDLGPVFELKPQVLVVGQGAYGRMCVPPEARQALADASIELVALHTPSACATYNTLSRDRTVAAALHLTC